MDNASDVAYQVVDALFGPDSGIPWWAWVAPIIAIFAVFLYPVMFPEAAAAEAETDRRLAEFRRERAGKGKSKDTGKKGKKAKK
ncbi:hypothetical protein [Actinoplanes palleronii]|uniref:Uncharacterized protein n=1 Tax=Actinoplanes palleronii TaxID=113570 RepID=A0ABQ4B2E0_9ACTN|nr:hypothetical protein [Actinoplanes palleronii]GIE64843.1 hypothetical protein Apa02nite_009510 [Actinoplanes palleronii]